MNLGWGEMAVIGVVALLVIGPRDLPEMFRQLGRLSGKLKGMAREFSRAMEAAANDAGIKDVAKDLNSLTDPKSAALTSVKDAMDKFEKWDPIKPADRSGKAQMPPPLTPPPMPATPLPKPKLEVEPATEVVGPNTAALYEKQAARKAIMDEAAARIKALDQPAATPAEVAPKPKRAPRKKPNPEAQA